MKRINLFLVATIAVFAVACGGAKQEQANDQADNADGETMDKKEEMTAMALSDGTYMLAEGSKVAWLGSKVQGLDSHNGTIDISEGKFMVKDGIVSGGDFTMDMTTLHSVDLADNEDMYNKLLGHLKSDDFFSVESNPKAMFAIKEVMAGGEGEATHTVKGDLTIKGITNEVTFPATFKEEGGMIKTMAEFEIDRTKWDVKYGSQSFFDVAVDKAIDDAIKITLDLTAKAAEGDMTEEGEAGEEM